MLKNFYYAITFAAALIIIGAGSWCAYKHLGKCGCAAGCVCVKCKCTSKNHCVPGCNCNNCGCTAGCDCGTACSCKEGKRCDKQCQCK